MGWQVSVHQFQGAKVQVLQSKVLQHALAAAHVGVASPFVPSHYNFNELHKAQHAQRMRRPFLSLSPLGRRVVDDTLICCGTTLGTSQQHSKH